MRPDLLRGHLDALVLAVLADEPGHGYEIGQRLLRASDGTLAVNEGSLYPALHRLEGKRLVKSAWTRDGGRRRRVYRLTPAGRRAVGDSRREWSVFSAAVDRILNAGAAA